MKSIMIVVADSSRARIFTTDSPSTPLHEVQTMAHPEGRMHEQDMVSDLPGKGAGNSDHHAYQEIVEPKQQEMIAFAKRTGDYLEDARKADKISSLLVVAAPAFLGELRKQMSDETNEMVAFELDKNLTQHNIEDIRNHLPKYLTH